MHLFSGHIAALSGARDFFPRIQGHEIAAVLHELGPDAPPHLEPGMRVAVMPETRCGHCYPCRSGRSNVCVRLRLVGVHLDGGLAQRAGCQGFGGVPGRRPGRRVHGVRRADVDRGARAAPSCGPTAGEKVLILGAGPIGLAAVLAATAAGLEPMVADPEPYRRALALDVGAAREAWGDPAQLREATMDWTHGDGPPLVIEASGAEPALALATEAVSHAGRVVMVGMSSGAARVRPGIFPDKEIDVLGSSTACPPDFGEAVRLVAANRASVSKLLTHQFPLSEAAEAFRFAARRAPGAVKVQITVSFRSAGGGLKRDENVFRCKAYLTGALAITSAKHSMASTP